MSSRTSRSRSRSGSRRASKKKEVDSPKGVSPRRGRRNLAAEEPERKEEKEEIEFGGPFGAVFIMIMSHCTLYYLWISWRFFDAKLLYPSSFSDIVPWTKTMIGYVIKDAAPNTEAWVTYWGFLIFQGALFMAIPAGTFLGGVKMKGMAIPHLGGQKLEYNCNGIITWYVSLATLFGLHFSGIWRLNSIYHNFGPLMTVAMLSQDAISIVVYVWAHLAKQTHRMSGNHIYDFFMGAVLNPRIPSILGSAPLDLKMWAEIREAWTLLFFLTCGAAAHQFEKFGQISPQMWFMLLAHFLYTNATHKGEECVPTTWDIFHEKWGWMLIFWNGAGVPYVYCFQSWFIATHDPATIDLPHWFIGCLFVFLLTAYYLWDTVQRQRNSYRMKRNGTYVERWSFPQFANGVMEADAKCLKTKAGSTLLVDGLWAYGRKLHYTADICMALSWGLICGFTHVLPYFYVFFFVLMISHRTFRDLHRCEKKYGEDWQRYKEVVPHLFIPGVF